MKYFHFTVVLPVSINKKMNLLRTKFSLNSNLTHKIKNRNQNYFFPNVIPNISKLS